MSFGERLRKLRTGSRTSVRRLAQEVGVSASFIYQLERGEVSPSYSTLQRMARSLGVSPSLLMDSDVPEEWVVARRDERKNLVVDQEGVGLEIPLFLGSRNRRMFPLFFELEEGAIFENTVHTHECECLVYVDEGTVTVAADSSTFHLREGDLAYLTLDPLASITNSGEGPARGFIVVTPPDGSDLESSREE